SSWPAARPACASAWRAIQRRATCAAPLLACLLRERSAVIPAQQRTTRISRRPGERGGAARRAGDRQPRVAASLWPLAGRYAQRFRPARISTHTPGTVGRFGGPVRAERLVAQVVAPRDSALGNLQANFHDGSQIADRGLRSKR